MYHRQTNDFEHIREAYEQELLAFALARVSSLEAEDILQEVWLDFSRAQAEHTIEQPRAWLFRVLRNRLVDATRLRSRRPNRIDFTDFDLPISEPAFELDPDEFWDRFDQALEILPAPQAEVFVRNELKGETLREIALDLGEKLKTIISRKQYAKQRLRAELQDWYDEFFTG